MTTLEKKCARFEKVCNRSGKYRPNMLDMQRWESNRKFAAFLTVAFFSLWAAWSLFFYVWGHTL